MDTNTIKEETENLDDAIAPQSIQLSRQVRETTYALRDKTEMTPYAEDTLLLSDQVTRLCDYVENLHENVETLLTKIEANESPAEAAAGDELSPRDKKAKEIQRETHELHPTVKDTIKALFMWRDTPGERLRDDRRSAEESGADR